MDVNATAGYHSTVLATKEWNDVSLGRRNLRGEHMVIFRVTCGGRCM